mgnify:FL=1
MALFRAGRLQNVYFYPKWDSTTVIDFLDAHEVDAAIFSTVTEYDPQAIAILRQRLPYFLKFDHSSELPIKIGYATPETLGLDRIAAVVGAVMQCPDKAVLIVDAGTCVTYALLTADGTFAGGNIAPGIRLRLRAMHEHTGKLPLIDDAGETPEIGFSTETAMLMELITLIIIVDPVCL